MTTTSEWAATAGARADNSLTRICTFRVGNVWLGSDVRGVQEVLRDQSLTGVPCSPDIVEGLLNLRGEIVVAIDVRRRLWLDPTDDPAGQIVVVLRTQDDERVSLLVDEVGDVVDVEGLVLEPLPETAHPAAREVVSGTYQTPTSLLLLIDAAKLCDVRN